jgi:hypothetical protein
MAENPELGCIKRDECVNYGMCGVCSAHYTNEFKDTEEETGGD